MVHQLKVFAIYGKGWNPSTLLDEQARVTKSIPPNWQLIVEYDDIDDLISQVGLLLTIDPQKPCLQLLEIDAHGCPSSVNGFTSADVKGVGQKLMKLKWCDSGSIYLSGCNTGVTNKKNPVSPMDCIAAQLASAMKFKSPLPKGGMFYTHLTVYGSLGYLGGDYMEGNAETSTTYSEGTWPFNTDYPPYEGSKDGTSNDCYRGYPNW